jgi:hypothetical protein|tara:strand:- start:1457 stop:2050 length:594 start_codon:yes stop_codon:yes gene_type:complete
MTNINKHDLLTLEEYSNQRESLRSEVIKIKKNRLIQIGDHISLLFESVETIKYQIQEMLRIEKIFEAEGIEEELAAYNPLIPDGSNLKATMLIEYPDKEIRSERLKDLHLIENKVWLQIGENERVFAIADEDLERSNEEKTSAVHFLRFEFDQNMIKDFKNSNMLYAGTDHPNYNIKTKEISVSTIESLAADFNLSL